MGCASLHPPYAYNRAPSRSLRTRMFFSVLETGTRTFRYAAVRRALEPFGAGAFDSLPMSLRILAENIARRSSTEAPELLGHLVARRRDVDIPYYPARVVLQDLLGTPALVDMA